MNDDGDKRHDELVKGLIFKAGIPPIYADAAMTDFDDCETVDLQARLMELAVRSSIESRGRRRYSLLMIGDFGIGKTHAASVCLKNWFYFNTERGWWRSYYQFIRDVQNTYAADPERSFTHVMKGYEQIPILLLDDIGDIDKGPESQNRRELVHQLLDQRNMWQRPTILTTNLTPDMLAEQFTERVWQRIMEMCCVIQMHGPNQRLI